MMNFLLGMYELVALTMCGCDLYSGGTHVDAPFHFAKDGITVDRIPLQSLIAFCHVIDISAKCDAVTNTTTGGCDYCLQPEDIQEHESEFGPISEGNIVLIRTGWHKNYSRGPKAYLGFDERVDGKYDTSTSSLSFPGIGPAAARVLVGKKVAAVGLDTGITSHHHYQYLCLFSLIMYIFGVLKWNVASLDPGCSKDFTVHRILLGAGVYGIENVNDNIRHLPRTGFTLLVMPIKLVGGSGAPARVTAVIAAS